MIRLLVVEDSRFMSSLILDSLKAYSDITVIGTARDGFEAVELVRKLSPDCVTMDVNMPHLGGVEATRRIMAETPVPIVMLSAHTTKDAHATIQALDAGAVDFVEKPGGEVVTRFDDVQETLVSKIRAAARVRVNRLVAMPYLSQTPAPSPGRSDGAEKPTARAVAIGASTGGPRLLKQLLSSLGAGLPTAILVAQHMPCGYTAIFAEQLNAASPLFVAEARSGDEVMEGHVYIAPGDLHMTVEDGRIRLIKPVSEDLYTPSVNRLFESASRCYRTRCLGIVLTGMGDDGARGLQVIKAQGGRAFAQDEATSIVFGMPAAAVATGDVDEVLPIEKISRRIERWVSSVTPKAV